MGVFAADTLQGPSVNWFALSPLLIMLGGALVLLVLGALAPEWPRRWYARVGSAVVAGVLLFMWGGPLALLLLVVLALSWRKRGYATFTCAVALGAFAMCFALWHRIDIEGPSTLVGGAMHFDKTAVWVTATIAVAIFLASLVTDDYLRREGLDGPELYALYLLAAIGGVVMGSANDLIVLFLGIEILSIALYVMAASHRKRIESQESGLKYFVLGGFSSAFFLYGVALVYNGTGSTNFDEIVNAVNATIPAQKGHEALMLAGVALLLVGLAFKVAAVPFHFWAPDVYQGAPTPVTAFMASAAKAAAFAAMLRVLLLALPHWSDDYRPVVWALAAMSVVIGSIMAAVQTNVKRMLAFSSISHAGFMLVGVEAATHRAGQPDPGDGPSSVLLYTLIYAVLVIGTFAVVTAVSRTGDAATDLGSFRGLGKNRPVLALAMTVLLLAQAGVPLTSGFIAKFGVIWAAVQEHSYAIAIIAMVAAVIAAYLYLRIMVSMWISEPEAGDDTREAVRTPAYLTAAIALSVGFTLVVGLFPDWLIRLAP